MRHLAIVRKRVAKVETLLSATDIVIVELLGSGHYLWQGVAPKRKGLGKQNFE